MRTRNFAIAALLFVFAWLAVASSAAPDASPGPKLEDGGSVVQQSGSIATIAVVDRGSRARSTGFILANGTLGVGAGALTVLCLGAAFIAAATASRPLTRYESLQRGPPAF